MDSWVVVVMLGSVGLLLIVAWLEAVSTAQDQPKDSAKVRTCGEGWQSGRGCYYFRLPGEDDGPPEVWHCRFWDFPVLADSLACPQYSWLAEVENSCTMGVRLSDGREMPSSKWEIRRLRDEIRAGEAG